MSIFNLSDKDLNYTLFGILLGDGWLHNRTNNNKKMLGLQHSMKQENYMRWIEKLARYWGIYRRSYYNKEKVATFGQLKYCEMFLTLPDERHFVKFNRFHDQNGIKIISKYVMKRITPLGLLFWFLDDGNLSVSFRKSLAAYPKPGVYRVTRQASLSTYGFNLLDHQIAQKYLKDRFDIDVKIHHWSPKTKDKQYLKLYFSATSFRKFFDLVRPYLPYIPEDMQYKFDMKYNPSRPTTRLDEQLYISYNMPIACNILSANAEDNEIVHSL